MELEKDVLGVITDSNTARDEGILFEYDLEADRGDAASATPTATSSINIPPEIKRPNEASRLSNVVMANPVGMQGMPTETIDPNRAALAFGPTDMLAQPRMAAQGGIMNARKQIQRVA